MACFAAVRVSRCASLVALWGVAVAAAPQQRAELPVLSIRTDLVTLAVTVVDRQGVFVPGLRPENFTVYDNGERQTIQFFTDEDLPATIGLLIDSSGSMRGRREQVTAAAAAFASMRHSSDEFFTLNFNEVVWPGLPPAVSFTEDPDQLLAAVSAAPARGMTALYDALDRALGHLDRGTRDRKALILVSDGGDNASTQALDAVLDRARRTGAAIYPVTVFDPDNRDARPQVLNRLARDTGGRTFTARAAGEVAQSFSAIAEEIRSSYTMGFEPETPGGGFRTIRVAVDAGNHRQLTARTRAGYYAGPAIDEAK